MSRSRRLTWLGSDFGQPKTMRLFADVNDGLWNMETCWELWRSKLTSAIFQKTTFCLFSTGLKHAIWSQHFNLMILVEKRCSMHVEPLHPCAKPRMSRRHHVPWISNLETCFDADWCVLEIYPNTAIQEFTLGLHVCNAAFLQPFSKLTDQSPWMCGSVCVDAARSTWSTSPHFPDIVCLCLWLSVMHEMHAMILASLTANKLTQAYDGPPRWYNPECASSLHSKKHGWLV